MQGHANKTERILDERGRGQGRIAQLFYERLDALKESPELDEQARTEQAWAAHETANTLMRQAAEQANRKLGEREAELTKHLFGAPSGAAAEALARAATADEEQLASLSRMAAKTGNAPLAKAVFTVAHERGRGDLMNEYLQNNPQARPHFEELASIPTPEERQEVLDNSTSVIPAPTGDQVRLSAQAAQRSRGQGQPLW